MKIVAVPLHEACARVYLLCVIIEMSAVKSRASRNVLYLGCFVCLCSHSDKLVKCSYVKPLNLKIKHQNIVNKMY